MDFKNDKRLLFMSAVKFLWHGLPTAYKKQKKQKQKKNKHFQQLKLHLTEKFSSCVLHLRKGNCQPCLDLKDRGL